MAGEAKVHANQLRFIVASVAPIFDFWAGSDDEVADLIGRACAQLLNASHRLDDHAKEDPDG